jgi:hypothetical protein
MEGGHYTVVAEKIGDGAWHLRVPRLAGTWTVAFDLGEPEQRARERIALDLDRHPDDFDVEGVTRLAPTDCRQ